MNKFSFFKKVNSNKLLFGMIPNLITSVRIIMTLYIIWMLGSNKHNISIFLSINSLIFISDIIDGRIARYLKSVSSFGEILDISADFLYILSMSIIMNIKNIIPRNYIVIVIIEFTIFIITSKYIKQDKRYLGFDILGRILAVLFYIIPVMMFFIFIKYEAFYRLISRYVFYLIYVLTFIVIAYRSYLCIKKTKSHFIKVDEEIIGGNKNENRNCI